MDLIWSAFWRLAAPVVGRSAEAIATAAVPPTPEDPGFYIGRAYEVRVRFCRLGSGAPGRAEADAEAVFVFTTDLLRGVWETLADWARKTEQTYPRGGYPRSGWDEEP